MLCAAHALVQRDEAEILAIVHDTGCPAGVGAISAISEWWGHTTIPLGGYHGDVGAPDVSSKPIWTKNGRGSYVDELVRVFKPKVNSSKSVPTSLHVYLSVLGAAPAHSVVVLA